jgi:hypothetical protein
MMPWWLIKNKIKELLQIDDRLYRCEYCGVYTYIPVVKKAITRKKKIIEWNFCCEGCKDLYIDNLLSEQTRKTK